MCNKHFCRVTKTYDDCIMMRCDYCNLEYAVDRTFFNFVLQGVWPYWMSRSVGVRWL